MKKIILLFLVLLPNLAYAGDSRPNRPHWSLELKGGEFFPQTAGWSQFYGQKFTGEYGAALSYKIIRQLEVGVEGSYSTTKGQGQQLNHGSSGTVQAGQVTFEHAPLNVFLLARGIFTEKQWLVPYVGGGYTRMFYRERVQGQDSIEGSVNGYHARGGIQLLLDGLDSTAANNFYHDIGVHHTYLFMEAKHTRALADTVSADSVNIGGTSYLGGLLFEF